MTGDGARMAAGIASLAAHARAQAERERLDAEKSAARPAPASITGRPGRGLRGVAQTVRCPICGVPVGEQCRTRTRSQKPLEYHPSRLDAARATDLSAATSESETFQTQEGS